MPRTYSSIDKIRAELGWVNETADPNKCGCRSLRAATKQDRPGACSGAVATNSGRFDGSTIARPAVNMDGAELSLVAI